MARANNQCPNKKDQKRNKNLECAKENDIQSKLDKMQRKQENNCCE